MTAQEAKDLLKLLSTILEYQHDFHEYARHDMIRALNEVAIPALEERIKEQEQEITNKIFAILDIPTVLNPKELDKQMELYKRHQQVSLK